jgi:hypothetical protein
MNNSDDKTDIRFRKLFERTGLENPSDGFTAGVMDRIAGLQQEAGATEEKDLLRKWAGYAGIALLVILGLSIMYYFGVGILPDGIKPLLSPNFANLFSSFKGIFDSVEVSNTTIAIILGFAFLVVLERVLSRLRTTKNMYFYF